MNENGPLSSVSEFCLAYECPLPEVPEELLIVCNALGDECSTCSQRCCLASE